MEGMLNLSRCQRRTFSKHFLIGVHANIGCAHLVSSDILAKKTELTSTLKKIGFDVCHDIFQGQVTLSKTEGQLTAVANRMPPLGLRFVNPSSKFEFAIQNGMFAASDTDYKSIEEFLEKFEDCFNQVKKLLGIDYKEKTTRIGLRKINSIIIKPVTALSLALNVFNPSLFGVARSGLFTMENLKNIEDVALLEKNSYSCIIRSKLQRQGIDSLIAQLDFDLISQNQMTIKDAFSKGLIEINQTHFDLFMWSITKDMLNLME